MTSPPNSPNGSRGPDDLAVDEKDLDAALAEFAPKCRALRRAWVSPGATPTVRGTFAIPAPYYIDDTGHFNSVEFNLCAEQLLAVFCYWASGAGPAPRWAAWPTDGGDANGAFRVTDLESTFARPMHPARFVGALTVEALTRDAVGVHLRCRVVFENTPATAPASGQLRATRIVGGPTSESAT